MTTEQMIEEALIDMEKHYCRLNGQDDGYLVKKTTMREILTTIATKSAEEAQKSGYEKAFEEIEQYDAEKEIGLWYGGIKFAINAVNLSLVGLGCRFNLSERKDIEFFNDVDERGNELDLTAVVGRKMSREFEALSQPKGLNE